MKGYRNIYSAYSAVEAVQNGKTAVILWADEDGTPHVKKVNEMTIQEFADLTANGEYQLWESEVEE